MEETFYNISMYLYNKNVLENAQIVRNETESKISYIALLFIRSNISLIFSRICFVLCIHCTKTLFQYTICVYLHNLVERVQTML